jgi:hypothetical protein
MQSMGIEQLPDPRVLGYEYSDERAGTTCARSELAVNVELL